MTEASLDNPQVTSNNPEIAAFCLVIGCLSLYMLDCLSGSLFNIDKYISSRYWDFLKEGGASYSRYLGYFRFIITSLIFMCPVALFVWVGTLYYTRKENNDYMIGPTSILLVGLFAIFILLGIFFIKWRGYKMSTPAIVFLCLGGASFIIYQLCADFTDVKERSFFGISAIFLCYNGIVFMFIIFLNSGKNAVSFHDVMSDSLPEKNTESAINVEDEFSQQLTAQKEDKGYVLSKEEIDLFYTITKEDTNIFRGGIVREFGSLSDMAQRNITIILYIVSVGILLGYAFIIYNTTTEYRLGWVTFIATVTTDSIIYNFAYVGVSQSVLQLCFLSIVFRLCLFGFGGTYWFYGYCLLYGILGVIVCGNISAKRFPLIDAIQADTAAATTQSKKDDTSKYMKDLMKSPEFILIYSTIIFAILTVALAASDVAEGIPLPSLFSGTTEYKFWTLALLAFGVVIFSYLIISIVRILIRRRQRIIDETHIYFFASFFDVFWIHVYLCYALLVIAGIIAYALSGNNHYIIFACFFPMIIIFLIYVFMNYSLNDFHILKDIKAENEKRKYLQKMKNPQKDQNKNNQGEVKEEDIAGPAKGEEAAANEDVPADQPPADQPPADQPPADHPPADQPPADKQLNEEAKGDVVTGKEGTELPIPGGPRDAATVEEDKKAMNQSPDKTSDNLAGSRAKRLSLLKGSLQSQATSRILVQGQEPNLMELALREAEASDELEDWTVNYNVFRAYFLCKLHPNDYRIINGLVATVILIFFNSLTMHLANNYDGGWYGATLGFIILDVFLIVSPVFRYLWTDLRFEVSQIVSIVIGLGIHIAYGIVWLAGHEKSDMDVHFNAIWSWFYIVFIPGFITIACGIYKWQKKKWKINAFTVVMTILTVGLAIIFLILLWTRYGWVAGIVVLIIAALVVYLALVSYFYAANNYYMPLGFKITNIVLVCLACCAVMIASWIVSDFAPFVGFSITYILIFGGAMIYFFFQLINTVKESDTSPIFFSPYIFPVYQYNPLRQTSLPASFNTAGLFLCLLAGLFWAILLSIYLQPMYPGISVTSLMVLLIVFLTLFLISYTPFRLQDCKTLMDKKLLSRCWLDAKKKFVEGQNAINLAELVSYKELRDAYQAVATSSDQEGVDKIQLGAKVSIQVDISKLNERQRDDLLFDIEELMRSRYLDEIHFMVDFQLLGMMSSVNARTNMQSKTVNFLKSKDKQLKSFGISIRFQGIVDPTVRHSLILAQLNLLTPEQQARYNALMEEYDKELEVKRLEMEERDKKAKLADEQRMKERDALDKIKGEKKKQQMNQKDLPIEEMIDCPEKYKKIVARFEQDKKPFEDNQFPAEEKSLGPRFAGHEITWKPATPDMQIYVGGVSALDVVQGELGDCYFLSAISVIGEKFVKQCIVCTEEESKCGAYLVKFMKGGEEEEYVIVDNKFPWKKQGWAFVTTQDGKELWPMILEKAYAKMNGSYQNIEAGKVQYALADLTGGAPEQIKLDDEADKVDSFWARVYEYYKAGYLLGAGSPENPEGDSAKSNTGIVQGHAYAILELNEFEGERLLKMRNPHGYRGMEWNGDWCDGSPKWSEAAKAKMNYQPGDDGAFWMNLPDFMFEYKMIYICRIFDKKWKSISVQMNKGAQISKNPHYALRVTCPCTLFIKVMQYEKENMFKGKQSIYFLLANNNGERVQKVSTDITVVSSAPPTDLIAVTREVVLDTTFSYPMTFTILIAALKGGDDGKGTFMVEVNSTDQKFTLKEMS